MTDQLPPGVYVQDVFPPPVPSFLIGVPAFLGRARVSAPDDLLNTPKRLTLWPQFEETFGDAPDGFLPEAVRGFFENDGLLCYVVLLDQSGPVSARLQRGLAALDHLDDVDLICAPDVMAWATWPSRPEDRPPTVTDEQQVQAFVDLQQLLLDHCRDRGDRFAILDGVPAVETTLVSKQRDGLAGQSGGYAAIYYPWLWAPGGDGSPRYVPPCGHLAGIYSRSDGRIGMHKAPANEVVEGVLDLQVSLTKQQVRELYETAGGTGSQDGGRSEGAVNCLLALPGRGIRVWGARTLSADPAWRNVNACRLVGTISRWVERFMAGLVYEPNDVRLWVRIMREITAYLDGLFQRGALKGRTADEAFYVKCDNETNPSEVIDAGMVVTQIGVAPTVPAEFVILRAIHGTSGVMVRAA